MSGERPPLFTPRFFLMCGYTFSVFLTVFQLIPAAPYRILALGGSKVGAGLFLGLLTFASALSAPFTGALADRVGKRNMLVTTSLVLALFSTTYAMVDDAVLFLAFVPIHGVFWSGLLSASSAYMTDMIPPSRRAEGIGYWGLSTIAAMAVAPNIGFALYDLGWKWLCAVCVALNLVMAGIAARLPETDVRTRRTGAFFTRDLVEWRVLAVSLALFLYSFGYGGITTFVSLYADANGVAPRSLYLTALAVVILLTRPFSGRLADRIGHRKVLMPCLVLIALGLGLLALGGTRPWLLASAIVFGTGFGTAYPAFAAHVMKYVAPDRRGAAFGGMLAAFDTGIGTGSTLIGVLIQHAGGYRTAYAVAAALAAFSLPVFIVTERRFLLGRSPDGG